MLYFSTAARRSGSGTAIGSASHTRRWSESIDSVDSTTTWASSDSSDSDTNNVVQHRWVVSHLEARELGYGAASHRPLRQNSVQQVVLT